MRALAPFRRLSPGDRVAVVAPSSRPSRERVEAGAAVLRGWGLEPVSLPGVTAQHPRLPHLAGEDRVRADDLAAAWRDRAVSAIWCARGGHGAQRMLDLLPRGLFASGEPKPIVGFSDVTPLLHRAAWESGTQMVHGPALVGLGESDATTLEHLRTLLFEAPTPRTLASGLRAWAGGDVAGTLVGGNVALLAASVGTADLPPASGAVVLLEDVGQAHWVVDRALTQLVRSGWLTGVAGIIVGDFSLEDDPDVVETMLRDRLLGLGVPVWAGLPVGHGRVNLALPLGSRVRVVGGYLRLA